ncbi:hypothetical protein BF49_5260 [Bradyrhizobium sp.]|nr:hypothetical protein BF49_5260 [Bradyrhizobium sp.]
MIEVDCAGAGAKRHARGVERAGRSRRGARARADVERSSRTYICRDHNSRRRNDAAFRKRKRAGARVADVHARTVAPDRARARHPYRTERACIATNVGSERSVIDDRSTVRDRERARAKTADIEPAACSDVQTGARAGNRHCPRRVGRQSDGDAAETVHGTAAFDGERARAQTADHEVANVRPCGAGVGNGHGTLRTRQITNKAAYVGQCSAVSDDEHSCPVLTDCKV